MHTDADRKHWVLQLEEKKTNIGWEGCCAKGNGGRIGCEGIRIIASGLSERIAARICGVIGGKPGGNSGS